MYRFDSGFQDVGIDITLKDGKNKLERTDGDLIGRFWQAAAKYVIEGTKPK